MKPSTFILTLSVVANVALAALLLTSPSSENVRIGPESRGAALTAAGTTQSAGSTAGDATAPGKQSLSLWTRLKPGDDLGALVRHLREAGFPESVIRRVIVILVNERFDSRRLEIEKDNLNSPFWQRSQNAYMDPKVGPQIQKLQAEQIALLKELLGSSLGDLWADTDDAKAMLRLQVGNLAPEKLDRFYDAYMQYNRSRMDVYSAQQSGGTQLPADRAKLVGIEKAFGDSLASFLTPDEVNDVMMRMTESSYQLRMLLGPFKASEAEYRAIFPAFQQYLQQVPNAMWTGDNSTPDQIAARNNAQSIMLNQLKLTLGDERSADLQQALNPQYSMINRIVARLDLPLSAARQVADVQQSALQRLSDLRQDPTLSGPDRKAQLALLAEASTAKISAAIGTRGLDVYKQYGGQWLANITPKTQPAPKR